MRLGKSRYLPWYSKYSLSHMPTTAWMASCHCSRLASRSTPNAICSIGVDRPVPHSTRPLGEDVGGGHLLGDAHGRGERVGHQRDAEAEADVLGALRERADDHLGRRRVRAALAEVVLDVPGGVEAELVGQLDLLERLPVGLPARPAAGRRGAAPARASGRRSRRAGRASRATPRLLSRKSFAIANVRSRLQT